MSKIVNERISPEDIRDAQKIEQDPQALMRLIDMIFLVRDETKDIPS